MYFTVLKANCIRQGPCLGGRLQSWHPPRARPQAHTEEHEAGTLRAPRSSRCTICCNRCHRQRPWDASHITGVQWLPGMKRDVEKDLKVNQLNNDDKRRKKQKEQKTGSEIWWSALQSHLAAPPPHALCSALLYLSVMSGSCCRGKTEWVGAEWHVTKQNHGHGSALLCRDSLLHMRSAVGEGRPESKWSCVTCPLPAKDTRALMVRIKKKKIQGKILNFQCSHLTEGIIHLLWSQVWLWYCSKL